MNLPGDGQIRSRCCKECSLRKYDAADEVNRELFKIIETRKQAGKDG
jgi:hypothetical protein